ncbi:MAG: acyl carrier protein [Candidatus Limiplasma sp.]|jgi:acyl carrier protein|nr:acyl carrier protein [Clostridiales bacterium]MDD7661320.1 acyl carrier protein [Eubacteriales bacterium]MDY3244492.1 acyl carrier protein [Candidatus Limiplasma sp.]MDY4062435.1 acyl carrier protein [Candidatus Limiplasma sp.]
MVFEKVRDMIASQLQVAPESITMESRLVEDLKADSANVMVMILEMETEFGMEVEDEVILQLKTVGDIVDYIEKHQ